MVQLKVIRELEAEKQIQVSIPNGSIKRKKDIQIEYPLLTFQFLMVQLKGRVGARRQN